MFTTYEFTYAGLPASMFGMFVCDINKKAHDDNPFGNSANIVETRIANRITPLHYGVRYHDTPLSFTLIFGSEHPMDRYQMQEVARWLTGYQQYQWLSIDQPDMEHIQFRCIIQTLTPISFGWLPVAFEAKVLCDCPYGYSYPFNQTYSFSGTTNVRFYNDSTCMEKLRPMLTIDVMQGCSAVSIKNKSNGGKCLEFTNLPGSGVRIVIDNENCMITEELSGYDLYDCFNFSFFECVPGDNLLEICGNGALTISGRYLYNVGA